MSKIVIDNARCEALVTQGVAGNRSAYPALVEYLWPIWLEMVRSSRAMQATPNLEDGVHDVIARLVEKLGAKGRGIHLYGPWRQNNPEKFFEDWLRIVTKNAIRDYVREKVGSKRNESAEPGVKRLLNEFASAPVLEELGVRPPVTQAQTARELIEFARTRLPARQRSILESWLEGASFEEIGAELEISSEEARLGLRAAIAVLRRYFDGGKDG